MKQTYPVIVVSPYISMNGKAGTQRCRLIRWSVSCDLLVFFTIDKNYIVYLADFCAVKATLVPWSDDNDFDRAGNLTS
jgi:hypothetical protein